MKDPGDAICPDGTQKPLHGVWRGHPAASDALQPQTTGVAHLRNIVGGILYGHLFSLPMFVWQ